jgi:hypothetical protein
MQSVSPADDSEDLDDDDGEEAVDDPDFDMSEEVGSEEPRRKVPSFVMTAFNEHIALVKASTTGHGSTTKVGIYNQLGSFWFPKKHPFFYLQAHSLIPEKLLIPRFFYWDPQSLPLSMFRCLQKQSCIGQLTRHGYIQFPRRVLDLPEPFYLIGVRYKCNTCGHTCSSWDSKVMEQLPSGLASQFPAHLTWRSGMSKALFGIMRSCFQNGMGGKQFADMLNTLYRQRHEELEMQYMHSIIDRYNQGIHNVQYPPFPQFEAGAAIGPTGSFCRMLYDSWVEKREHLYDQHQSQLSTRQMAIDHSHKITKHIAKIKGEPVFIGLLTMTNEFGEIRVCDLVPSKAHSQYSIALSRMNTSIHQYGLPPPQVIFTDNMADKLMLEQHFPSLKTGVTPVGKDHLSRFGLPDGIQVKLYSSSFEIQTVINGLIEILTHGSEGSTMVVGLDTEWNVDLDHQRNPLPNQRRTAVMQLAHGSNIWIFQLSNFIRTKQIPVQLCEFLANPQVIKVGKSVATDL